MTEKFLDKMTLYLKLIFQEVKEPKNKQNKSP